MSGSPVRLLFWVFLALAALAACRAKGDAPSAGAPSRHEAVAQARNPKASDEKAITAGAAARPIDARKVIYKADLSLEVRSPGDVQAKVTSIVEREGGWVASAAREDSEGRPADVTLVLRVPAARFSAVLAELRRLGDGKHAERIDSEDVTDDYVDLDARLRVQTKLEEQLLELLKTATSVDAALHVHKELASVRTEIELIQGRKQLLEREVAMSTIKITLSAPAKESVSFSKIGRSFSDAYSDAVLVAGGIVVAVIRLTGILVPVAVMLGLPVLFAALVVRRRLRRVRPNLTASAS